MKKDNKIKKTIAITIAGALMTPSTVPSFADVVSTEIEQVSSKTEAGDYSEVKSTTPAACSVIDSEDNTEKSDDTKIVHLTEEQVKSAIAEMREEYNKSTSTDSSKYFLKYENDDSVSPKERTVSVNCVKEKGYEELMSDRLILQDKDGNEIKDVKWYAYSLEKSKVMLPEETESSEDSYIILHDDGSFTAKPLADDDKSQDAVTVVFAEYNGSLYYFNGKLKTLKDSKGEISGLVADKIVDEHPEWKTLPKHKAALEVHNYIIKNVYYPDKDTQWEQFLQAEKSDGYVYYALVKGYAVCNGYAKSYQALLKRIDIECEFVKGYTTEVSDRNTAHAWNLVKLEDDKWYLVDTTWDDVGEHGSTKYFLMDKEQFNRTHKSNSSYDGKEFGTIYLNNGNIQDSQTSDQTEELPYNKDTKAVSEDGKLSCEIKVTQITDSKVTVSFIPTKCEEYDSYGFFITKESGSGKGQTIMLGEKTTSYTFNSDGLYSIEYTDSDYHSKVINKINIKLGYQPSEENSEDTNEKLPENNDLEESNKENQENTEEKEEPSNKNDSEESDNQNQGSTEEKEEPSDKNDIEESNKEEQESTEEKEEPSDNNDSEGSDTEEQESTEEKEESSENDNIGSNDESLVEDSKEPAADSNNENIQDIIPAEQVQNLPYNKDTKSQSKDGKLSCEVKVTNVTNSKVEVLFNTTKNSAYDRYAFFIYKGVGSSKKPIETLKGDTRYYTFKDDGLYTIEYIDTNYISPVINEINIKLGYKTSQQSSSSQNHSSSSSSSGSSSNSSVSNSNLLSSTEDNINNNVNVNDNVENQTAAINTNDVTAAEEKTGWNMVDGQWHFVESDGNYATGWVKSPESGSWYHMNEDGTMATNKWVQDSGKWFYVGESGEMKTGWIQNNGVWYFLNTESGTNNGLGCMQTGWIKSPYSGKWYYCDASGAMLTNTTVNGYVLGADGAWIE